MKIYRTSRTLGRERGGSGSTRHRISSSRNRNTQTGSGYKRNQQIRKPVIHKRRHVHKRDSASGGGFVYRTRRSETRDRGNSFSTKRGGSGTGGGAKLSNGKRGSGDTIISIPEEQDFIPFIETPKKKKFEDMPRVFDAQLRTGKKPVPARYNIFSW